MAFFRLTNHGLRPETDIPDLQGTPRDKALELLRLVAEVEHALLFNTCTLRSHYARTTRGISPGREKICTRRGYPWHSRNRASNYITQVRIKRFGSTA